MRRQEVALVFNLLQDVNILRGLAYLIRRETDAEVHLLVTARFLKRDKRQVWQPELATIARDTGAEIHVIQAEKDAQAALQGRGGVIICASESDLGAHSDTASILRCAPSSFVSVTLQHGLECVGFRQSREHIVAHGRDVGFNADVICSWLPRNQLTATRVSERGKVVVTGPSTLLQRPRAHPGHPPVSGGIVCENMHSVRLAATGDHKASFMDIFFEFCARLQLEDKPVTLRPHPGGQYVLNNNIDLPANVRLNNLPVYDVNMKGYQYGISAPSTVVFDMVLAGLPVGIWRDTGGIMDLSNYKGLTEISTISDWIAFEREATCNSGAILARQAAYLEKLNMPTDPIEIYRRFTRLLQNLLGRPASRILTPTNAKHFKKPHPPKRILYVVNRMVATLQLSFLEPLADYVASGDMVMEMLTEEEIKKRFGAQRNQKVAGDWVAQRIADFAPDMIVCCRYSGPHADRIVKAGKACKAPVVYHIDDDLLNIPRVLGEDKWAMHNDPKRLHSVRTLLDTSDLVYASTPALHAQLTALGAQAPIIHGDIYCSANILRDATPGPVRRVGYMGTAGHAHDFEPLLPVIADYLDRNTEVTFELFGLNPVPELLQRFGERVQIVPSVASYGEFLKTLAERKWDIGICPLAHLPFNAMKANTKWVEYTSCGIATIATKGLVYDECAADGRGILVDDDEWGNALQTLTDDPELRYRMICAAQHHLVKNYSRTQLQEQILDIFEKARVYARTGSKISSTSGVSSKRRVLFISNGLIPTLQLSFLKPLAPLIDSEGIIPGFLTEAELSEAFGKNNLSVEAGDWYAKRIIEFKPDLVVCCRYSGPHVDNIIAAVRQLNIPLIYHVDDDLRNIPPEIGEKKYRAHNLPRRIEAVTKMLDEATLVYCSTLALKQRLRQQEVKTPIMHGDVYCSSRILRVAELNPVRRIGYMGFDHAHDFKIALPGLLTYLERNPTVEFELFGSIPMPEELLRFGARVRSIPPVRDYAAFLGTLADRKWDIGLCPLAHTAFNAVKANTKWVEYTACGMATIATKGLVYDGCAAEGRGLLVSHSEWSRALEALTVDPNLRYRMALQAQVYLQLNYSEAALTRQVLEVFNRVQTLHQEEVNRSSHPHSERLLPTLPNAQGIIKVS